MDSVTRKIQDMSGLYVNIPDYAVRTHNIGKGDEVSVHTTEYGVRIEITSNTTSEH